MYAQVVDGEVVRVVPDETHFENDQVPDGWKQVAVSPAPAPGDFDPLTHRIGRETLVVDGDTVRLEVPVEPIPETETRPTVVRGKAMAALLQVRNELANWPLDLAAGATLNQVGTRVNQLMAQERRNTQRLEKIIQLLLNHFDAPEA